MSNKAVVTGTTGELRWGYLPAARVASWTATMESPEAWRLRASLETVDAFRVTQRPLTFVVRRPSGEWRWPMPELQIDGLTLTAVVSPPQE